MKLKHLISLIQSEFHSWPQIDYPPRRNTRKMALMSVVLNAYSEICLIIERIIKSITEKEKIKSRRSLKKNRLIGSLILDIKSLYLWAYNVEEIFKNSYLANRLDLLELKRVCMIRHLFITHYPNKSLHQKKKQFLVGELRTGVKPEDVTISFAPFFHKRNHFSGLKRLEMKLRPYIPNLAQIGNYHLKISAIYTHFNLISDRKHRAEADQFIASVGIQSEPPYVVVVCLLEVLRQYRKAAYL